MCCFLGCLKLNRCFHGLVTVKSVALADMVSGSRVAFVAFSLLLRFIPFDRSILCTFGLSAVVTIFHYSLFGWIFICRLSVCLLSLNFAGQVGLLGVLALVTGQLTECFDHTDTRVGDWVAL